MFPQVALLDGKYMMGLSKNTTINTTIDALSHAIESYLSKRATPITKMYAVEAIRLIKEQFQNLISYDLTLEARNSLLYASTLAGICISQTGTTAVHTMGYSLTYFKEIDHGRANGLLLGEYLKVVEKKEPKSIAPVLEALGMSTDEFSDTLDKLLGEKDKVSLEEIKTYASKAMLQKNTKNSIIDLTQVELINIMSHVFL
jgi:alcohol dehydrogenase class IV